MIVSKMGKTAKTVWISEKEKAMNRYNEVRSTDDCCLDDDCAA